MNTAAGTPPLPAAPSAPQAAKTTPQATKAAAPEAEPTPPPTPAVSARTTTTGRTPKPTEPAPEITAENPPVPPKVGGSVVSAGSPAIRPAVGTTAGEAVTEPLIPVIEVLPAAFTGTEAGAEKKAAPHRIGAPPQPLAAPPDDAPIILPRDADAMLEVPPRGEWTPANRRKVQRRRRAALLTFFGIAAAVLLVGQVVRSYDHSPRTTTIAPAASALPPAVGPGAGIGEPTGANSRSMSSDDAHGPAGPAATRGKTAPADAANAIPSRSGATTAPTGAFSFVAGYGPVLGTAGTLRRFKVAVERTLGQGDGSDFADEVDRDARRHAQLDRIRPGPAAAGAILGRVGVHHLPGVGADLGEDVRGGRVEHRRVTPRAGCPDRW